MIKTSRHKKKSVQPIIYSIPILKLTLSSLLCLSPPLSLSSQPPPSSTPHSINQPQLGKYFLRLCQVHISTILLLKQASSWVRAPAISEHTGRQTSLEEREERQIVLAECLTQEGAFQHCGQFLKPESPAQGTRGPLMSRWNPRHGEINCKKKKNVFKNIFPASPPESSLKQEREAERRSNRG